MGTKKQLIRRISKELIANGYDSCDIHQVIDNFKIRIQRAATEEEEEEIIKEYKELYNVETTSL